MPWFRSPVKLFGWAGLLLLLVRLVFPPADGGPQLHFYLHFFEFRLDLTGYGIFDFAALGFLLCAVAYYLISRLTKRRPNNILVQLHFWPSLLFAVFAVFLAHSVNRISPSEVNNPRVQASLDNWCTVFMCVFMVFIIFQLAFAIGAVRSVLLHRDTVTQP
jgi:hypothetical protein